MFPRQCSRKKNGGEISKPRGEKGSPKRTSWIALHARKRSAGRFRFDGADGFAINEQSVVGLAGLEGQLAQRRRRLRQRD